MANRCSNIKDPKARKACLKAQKGGGEGGDVGAGTYEKYMKRFGRKPPTS